MVASRTGNVEAMKVLLDHGADVNAKETLRGTTALMWAADEGHAAAVQLLIQRGADYHRALESSASRKRNFCARQSRRSEKGDRARLRRCDSRQRKRRRI